MEHVYRSDAAARQVLEQYRAYLEQWPVPNEQHHVPTREGDTFVVASGSADKPPVVLLHGTMSNAAMWMREVAALAPHFRVYAVDIIGDAGLSAPSRPAFDTDAHARWLAEVMDALSVPRAVVVGMSLGGGIAVDLAIRKPERVAGLALLCPAGIANRNIIWWALPLLMLGPWGARKVRERIIGPPAAAPSDAETAFAAFTESIFKGMRPRTGAPIFNEAQLAQLTMPVLVLLGGRDPTIDSATVKQRMEKNAANAEVRILPEARHFLGDQSQAILAFLNPVHGRQADER